ncbi:hypothetical protein GGP62_003202 [Salinibacter ruber]|nr:hypothetical protein [Salinibacter ruber]
MIGISPGAMSPVRDAPGSHLVQIGHAVRMKNPGAGSRTKYGDIPRFVFVTLLYKKFYLREIILNRPETGHSEGASRLKNLFEDGESRPYRQCALTTLPPFFGEILR